MWVLRRLWVGGVAVLVAVLATSIGAAEIRVRSTSSSNSRTLSTRIVGRGRGDVSKPKKHYVNPWTGRRINLEAASRARMDPTRHAGDLPELPSDDQVHAIVFASPDIDRVTSF